jgi:methyl-accepting chemotaxis protein
MRFKDISLKTKIMIGSLIPNLLAVGLLIMILFSFQGVIQSMQAMDHSFRVVEKASKAKSSALNMQTGLRGYLLTGEDRYLDPLRQGESTLSKELSELKNSNLKDSQKILLQQIDIILASWQQDVAKPGMALRAEVNKSKGLDDLANIVAQGQGQTDVDLFDLQLDDFFAQEKQSITKLRSEAASATTVPEMQRILAALQQKYEIQGTANEIGRKVLQMFGSLRGFLLSGKDSFLDSYKAASKDLFSRMEELKKACPANSSQRRIVDQLESNIREWHKNVCEPEIALRREIDSSKTLADMKEWLAKGEENEIFGNFRQTFNEFKQTEDELLTTRNASVLATSGRVQSIVKNGTVIVVLLSLVISFLLSRIITKPLAKVVEFAESIGRGDLSKKLDRGGKDEIGRLTNTLNEMLEFLQDHTRKMLEGISVLAASAAEISATVAQLVASTVKTSSAITETTTTVEEVKQAAKISSDKAKKVAESAQLAVQITESGRKATDSTIHRMNLIKEQMESIGETVVRLSEHSQAIEDIIGSVQDLADQSNLLAVNASIEAARAGDQGKGFAVVAHEIKTLADQSKGATQQIRRILDETRKWVSAVVMATEQGSKAVEAGVHESALAGEAIQSLSDSVGVSSQAASVIHTSTEQQFVGVDQVSAAMVSIEQAMQQNTAGTSQLEIAARRIEELGVSLKQLVERYKLSS